MPRFEVFCPASPPALPADVTLQVDAENWLAALKAGRLRLGGAQPAAHILCDVQADGSIQVAEPQGGGVFRIRELHEASPSASPVKPVVPAVIAAAPASVGLAAEVRRQARAAPPPSSAPAPPRVEGRLHAPAPGSPADQIASLDRRAGLERLLDLALERLDAEAGSVLLVRTNGQELEFVAVRGPRAKELTALRATVRVGTGVVGYCVREGVALAVSDAQRDPRFLRTISVAIGYEARSILCVPIARQGNVLGALEVLNKRGGAPFGAQDLGVLSELAGVAAEHLARHGG